MKETFRLSDRFLKGCYCHQLFDLLQAGICITDSDGTIRFINSSYAKSFKMDPDKVIGKNITEFFPDSALINVMHSGLADRSGKELNHSFLDFLSMTTEISLVVSLKSMLEISMNSNGS